MSTSLVSFKAFRRRNFIGNLGLMRAAIFIVLFILHLVLLVFGALEMIISQLHWSPWFCMYSYCMIQGSKLHLHSAYFPREENYKRIHLRMSFLEILPRVFFCFVLFCFFFSYIFPFRMKSLYISTIFFFIPSRYFRDICDCFINFIFLIHMSKWWCRS